MSVDLTGITIRFGSLTALDNAGIELRDGEVHALLGANGSGKSTMVKILTGVYAPDAGRITIHGQDVTAGWDPAVATQAGVRVVHQEAPFLDTLSIAESVALFTGYPRRVTGAIAWRQLRSRTQELLDRTKIDRRPTDLARTLTGAERATLAVELATRAAGDSLRLLVLDEATAALPEAEATPFLEYVRTVADQGTPVLMVTHRLGELAWADRVTVMSAGRVALRDERAAVDHTTVIDIMRSVGTTAVDRLEASAGSRTSGAIQQLWSEPRESAATPGDVVLVAQGISGDGMQDVNLQLRAGEIVGAIGPRGGGVEALPRLLTGASPLIGGRITVNGKALPAPLEPKDAISFGVLHQPADRLHEGGWAGLPVAENVTLPSARRFWHRKREERSVVARVIEYLDVRPRDPQVMFGKLSGGNQQKVIIGRLLRMRPTVLVLADPTYGVDPAAREVMFDAIREARAAGTAVLVTSTEPEQLSGLCDRVLLVHDGAITEELTGEQLSVESLLARAH
jgi:ribose transport system ATP-binding protein